MRKQILIFGHDGLPQFIDIYNQYTLLFDPADYEVTVVYLTGEYSLSIQNKTLAENCIFLTKPKKKIRNLKISSIHQMLTITRKKRFDLVICHRYKPTYIMMWVAKFCHIPAMLSVMHELRTMRSLKRQLLIAALNNQNQLFAGVSNAVRDDLRRDLWCVPNHRIITLYNMIDVEFTESQIYKSEKARQELNLASDTFVFGSVARLVKNKDQTTLIKAFSIIKPFCPNTKLVLIGEGELKGVLKTAVHDYGLVNDVIFTGFLNNAFKYLKAFDCFILSSLQEAFGRVLLEAMIAKLPIIATNVNGIPEVIGDVANLVSPQNPRELASAMQEVMATSIKERQLTGERGYVKVINEFSIPVFQKQFSKIHALFNE